jgi:rhomboid protease GluP
MADKDPIDQIVDRFLRALGTNRVKLRWQWQRFKEGLGRRARAAENRSRSLGYEHQLCPQCGQPAGKDADRCVKCGAKLRGVAVQKAGRVIGALLPEGVPVATMVFLAACIGLYVVTVKWTYTTIDDASGFTPATAALYRFGANAFMSLADPSEVWRLVTANFLHGGVVHLGLNAYSIWLTGAEIEERFGPARTVVMLLVSGVCGHLFAAWWQLTQQSPPYPLVVGASTAAFGQIGFLLGSSLRAGRRGRDVRARVIPWLVYGLIMSFAIPIISWQGHVGGLVGGLLLGLVVADRRTARRIVPERVWAVLALGCVAVVAWAFLQAAKVEIPPGALGT